MDQKLEPSSVFLGNVFKYQCGTLNCSDRKNDWLHRVMIQIGVLAVSVFFNKENETVACIDQCQISKAYIKNHDAATDLISSARYCQDFHDATKKKKISNCSADVDFLQSNPNPFHTESESFELTYQLF